MALIDSPAPHVGLSCIAVGVARSAFYRWLETDELFAKKYDAITTYFWPPHRAYYTKSWLKEKHLKSYGRAQVRYDEQKQAQKIHNPTIRHPLRAQ